MDRLGRDSENTNMMSYHVGDAAQLAAIWQSLEVARKELEEKRKAESQTLPQLLSVTQTVTQEIPAPANY